MRGKSLFLLLLALGCGLVASIGITRVMAKRAAEGQSAASEMEQVVVAIKDLPMGDPVNAESIKLEDWPKDKVPPGALTRLEDAEKRRPKSRVFAGSPVLEAQLFGRGESDSAVGSQIPQGYRVVSVEAPGVSSSGGLIRPGDRVDLLLCVQANPSKRIQETSTRTILQDVKVFAVDGRFRLESEDMDKVSPVKMVSLLVTPEQAQRVTLASELGQIRLAMRSPEDQTQPKVAPSNPTDLFGVLEGADRDKESEPSVSVNKPDKMGDFLQFLRGQRTTVPGSRPSYNVRVITGTKVNDVRLELASESGSGGIGEAGPPVWKVWQPPPEAKPESDAGMVSAEPPVPPAEPEPSANPLPAEPTKPAKPEWKKPGEKDPKGNRPDLQGPERSGSRANESQARASSAGMSVS